MEYKCIKDMCYERLDDNGLRIPNEYDCVSAGTTWYKADANIIGGKVRLETKDAENNVVCWIEVTADILNRHFRKLS